MHFLCRMIHRRIYMSQENRTRGIKDFANNFVSRLENNDSPYYGCPCHVPRRRSSVKSSKHYTKDASRIRRLCRAALCKSTTPWHKITLSSLNNIRTP